MAEYRTRASFADPHMGHMGDSAAHWLERGMTREMAQNEEILTYLQRLSSQMESMLSGQEKIEEAVCGRLPTKASRGREASSSILSWRNPSQRSAASHVAHEKSNHVSVLEEPIDFSRAPSDASQSPSPEISFRMESSEFSGSAAPLQQRVLVPDDGFGDPDAERVEQGGLQVGSSADPLTPDTGFQLLSPGLLCTPYGSRMSGPGIFPMNPDGKRRTVLDILTSVVLLYDCIVIPVQVAWNLPLEGFLLWGYALTLTFWTVDFLLGFVTSYYKDGKLVTDYKKIMIHYLKNDLLITLLCVLADWIVIFIQLASPEDAESETTFARAIRIVKVHRIIHVMRVMKNGNIAKIYDRLTRLCFQRGFVEQFQGFTRILSIFCFILWINHLGACFWRWLGHESYDEYLRGGKISFRGCNEYLIMVYWSVSAIIAGESIMDPQTPFELACTICFILGGLILVSVLVSNLSASLLDLRLANQDRHAKEFKLRQYFYQNFVRQETAMPIQTKISERLTAIKPVTDKDIAVSELLDLIPPWMRNNLKAEVYGPKMESHFFIRACSSLAGSDTAHESMIMEICCKAMANEVFTAGKVVFQNKTEAIGAYYLNWGGCEYFPGSTGFRSRSENTPYSGARTRLHSTRVATVSRTRPPSAFNSVDTGGGDAVSAGAWISEVALWVHWKHCGLLEVCKTSEMCIINADAFVQVIKVYTRVHALTRDYSNAMFKAIQKENRNDVTDVRLGVDDEFIIAAMEPATRKELSMSAFHLLHNQSSLFSLVRATRDHLYNEVQQGKCDLIVGEDGEVLRLVNVVALSVVRNDGKMLRQIASVSEDGVVEPKVDLPGTKVKAGEVHTQDARQRLLDTQLSVLAGGFKWGIKKADVKETTSKKYGVPTKYMRNIYHAKWDEQFVHDALPEVGERASASNTDLTRSSRALLGRPNKFKEWFALKPFVAGASGTRGERRIFMWIPQEELSAMLADEDHVREWVSRFDVEHARVPVADTPDTSNREQHDV